LKIRYLLTWIGVLILLVPSFSASAQDQQIPNGPVYIVQQGDTLDGIALRFGVSSQDLQNLNHISDPNKLATGMQLIIPGLEGIQGVLETRTITFGDDLNSLSQRYQIPRDTLARLNHLVSPNQLYIGSNLVILQGNPTIPVGSRVMVTRDQSLLELAVIQGMNPWSLVSTNDLPGTWGGVPGEILQLPDNNNDNQHTGEPGALPETITSVTVDPIPLVQGRTTEIRLLSSSAITITGSLNNHTLHFFQDTVGTYISLQGIDAMTDPGIYPITINGTLANGSSFAFSQGIPVIDGKYLYDAPLTVDPETIDPLITGPENELWNAIPVQADPVRLWDGLWKFPGSALFANCYPSVFGSRRSYNGGPYIYYHTGLDICGGVGQPVYAAAGGTVVYTGTLTVRGNAIMLNHGWGIYSGYEHLSKILVNIGDHADPGQLIGYVGGTGRVTGAHLHFEIWVGEVQINPQDWLDRIFP
jgi:murein DD-endopeptidase MepM/ murein hydrolase activator NlpD